jgi:hypothetical protein
MAAISFVFVRNNITRAKCNNERPDPDPRSLKKATTSMAKDLQVFCTYLNRFQSAGDLLFG